MEEPFARAVDRHGATVLRVCRALLGVSADADDAWAETFLGALKAWPTLDPDTNVEAWLVRVAHRRCIDLMRTRTRRAVPVETLPEQRSRHGNPDAEALTLWKAVEELPDRQRQAVACHYFGGLSHVETADLIGTTPAAVRRASADGVRKLRELYREECTSTHEGGDEA